MSDELKDQEVKGPAAKEVKITINPDGEIAIDWNIEELSGMEVLGVLTFVQSDMVRNIGSGGMPSISVEELAQMVDDHAEVPNMGANEVPGEA